MKIRSSNKRKSQGLKVVHELNPWVRFGIVGGVSFLFSLAVGIFFLSLLLRRETYSIEKVMTPSEFSNIQRDSSKYIEAEIILDKLKKDPASIVLVDLRSEKDFRAGHIAQAISVPDISPQALELIGLKYHNKLIVLYAAASAANEPFEAYEIMKEAENVRILVGGMEAWKKLAR